MILMKNKVFVGIDYSMVSPAICVCRGDFQLSNCQIHYFAKQKKHEVVHDNLMPHQPIEWETPEERFHLLSNWATWVIPEETDWIGIEDYSYSSKGMIFSIGENTGLLKHKLWKYGHELHVYSPGSIKKCGAGKGNAKKPEMVKAFTLEAGFDIMKAFDMKSKNLTPVADIVDSYFVCKRAVEDYVSRSNEIVDS